MPRELALQGAPALTAVGLLIFLVGAIQFHVIQGQRAQFLSRFLAPQVAELVREQGLRIRESGVALTARWWMEICNSASGSARPAAS